MTEGTQTAPATPPAAEPRTAPLKPKRNTLTAIHTAELVNWMRAKRTTIDPAETYADIATRAAAELHFPVTPNNIKGMWEELGWGPRKPVFAVPATDPVLGALCRVVAGLTGHASPSQADLALVRDRGRQTDGGLFPAKP